MKIKSLLSILILPFCVQAQKIFDLPPGSFFGLMVSPDIVAETKPVPMPLTFTPIWVIQSSGTVPSVRYTLGFHTGTEVREMSNKWVNTAWQFGVELSNKGSFAKNLKKQGGWHFNRYYLDFPYKFNFHFGKPKASFCLGIGGVMHHRLGLPKHKRFSNSLLTTAGLHLGINDNLFCKVDLVFKYGREHVPSYQSNFIRFNRKWSLGLAFGVFYRVARKN